MISLDNRKKSAQMQLRTTEFMKEQICKLADKEGISKNAVLNQALAWYMDERAKNAAQ
ncbi:hypothetical protein LGZ99_21725 [Photorhabdus temperata]|uniref:Photorhabdus luminescens subsp. laumondii TTO1 complete genome segment 10/17 n=1 Tax=Photorhabdus laumondii subsp. laumondii (strain DSM 15139 / CIP 105565 / TT01) TaxID=243265 RepID=Q7N338_PHOLL|nr:MULTISPECIES: hypothetical protein [Photorhabdus]MCT8349746.1 hypothetical protein [Photorhabdus temperata]CAE15258.1 unnamed protein product [Photorhabdus laumondii subsp. laumondii TTO1]